MYRRSNREQLRIEEFFLPFGGKLSADNRWVKEAKLIPWDLVEELYAVSFKEERGDGRPPIPARVAYGALYIKEREVLTDERTVEHIAENAYMQYFLGYREFREGVPFDASMMTHFRKRFPAEAIQKINEELYRRTHPPKDHDGGDDSGSSDGGNRGRLILDATVAPSDIRYPTDLSLLNECRENTEAMIDTLWEYSERRGHKTGYSRKKARKGYLGVTKQRGPRKKKLRLAIGDQRSYVEKNLATIGVLLAQAGSDKLNPRQTMRLETIRKVAGQQREMYDNRSHICNDRIVSLRQPWGRPIKRGKAGADVEFGQKLEFAVVDGFTFLEKQSFDNFNEGVTLAELAEAYRSRFGAYPEAILADQIYRNRKNRDFCKQHGIRLSGPRLGRPKASEANHDKRQAYLDSCERNMVESRNGIVKRRYGMDRVMAYLSCTAMTEAALQVFVMNVAHLIRRFWREFSKSFVRIPISAILCLFLICTVFQ